MVLPHSGPLLYLKYTQPTSFVPFMTEIDVPSVLSEGTQIALR